MAPIYVTTLKCFNYIQNMFSLTSYLTSRTCWLNDKPITVNKMYQKADTYTDMHLKIVVSYLGTNLVAALASLQMNNFTHFDAKPVLAEIEKR